MKVTIEVSLYPLTENYEEIVLEFLDNLNELDSIQFTTNGMSTQIYGDVSDIFAVLGEQFEKIQSSGKAVLVMKAGPGTLRYDGKHSRELPDQI